MREGSVECVRSNIMVHEHENKHKQQLTSVNKQMNVMEAVRRGR